MDYKLSTAKEVYQAVLDGIKKESTAVLTPPAFNRLINVDAMTQWLNEKAPKGEFDQDVVDDLRNLFKQSDPIDKEPGKFSFELPKDYFRLKAVMFKLEIKQGKYSDWIPAYRMRSNSFSVSGVNPFRKPKKTRLYYMQQGNYILNIPETENVAKAQVFYYARPKPIVYDTAGMHQDGNLEKEQKKEIVDIAVRIFLERVKEERYQTQLTEEALKNQKL